jgi:hypothetical protein
MKSEDLKYRVKLGIIIAVNVVIFAVLAFAGWILYTCTHGARC